VWFQVDQRRPPNRLFSQHLSGKSRPESSPVESVQPGSIPGAPTKKAWFTEALARKSDCSGMLWHARRGANDDRPRRRSRDRIERRRVRGVRRPDVGASSICSPCPRFDEIYEVGLTLELAVRATRAASKSSGMRRGRTWYPTATSGRWNPSWMRRQKSASSTSCCRRTWRSRGRDERSSASTSRAARSRPRSSLDSRTTAGARSACITCLAIRPASAS
jgi:hypothetical protein